MTLVFDKGVAFQIIVSESDQWKLSRANSKEERGRLIPFSIKQLGNLLKFGQS